MKKTVIIVVLAMVLIGSCATQSANEAQRIVGTWVCEDPAITLVFYANGTGTEEGGVNKTSFFYGISASGVIYITGYGTNELYMSPDGRRMFIGRDMYQKK